jgi:hypothetical protein
MAHYMQNHLSFEEKKKFSEGVFFFILFSLQAPCVIVTNKNTKYALRAANPRAADRPAGGQPPKGHIVLPT